MRLDPVPAVQMLRSEEVDAPNGKFPLVFFNSHINTPQMKQHLKTPDGAQMIVPDFPSLLNGLLSGNLNFRMLLRFRPNFDGLVEGNPKFFVME